MKLKKRSQTGTTKREPISRKVRFDVFNRDNFTCTYCGQKAPNVVMHVDHIKPVAKGGSNAFGNLTTACSACNSGKCATEIIDHAAPDDIAFKEMQVKASEKLDDIKECLMSGLGSHFDTNKIITNISEILCAYGIDSPEFDMLAEHADRVCGMRERFLDAEEM